MNALGDSAQTARAMVNRVHRRHDGEKNLGRANIAGRFVAADVLLACLQRESVCRSAFGVVRNANKTSRHVAFVLIARGKIGGMWSTESERNTKPLRVPDGNVSAKFAGRLQQCECESVGSNHNQRAGVVGLLNEFGIIVNCAVGCRILNQRAENGVVELAATVRSNCQAPEKMSDSPLWIPTVL